MQEDPEFINTERYIHSPSVNGHSPTGKRSVGRQRKRKQDQHFYRRNKPG